MFNVMNNLNYIKVSLNGKITLYSPPYNRECLKTFFLLAKPQLSKPKPNIPKLADCPKTKIFDLPPRLKGSKEVVFYSFLL